MQATREPRRMRFVVAASPARVVQQPAEGTGWSLLQKESKPHSSRAATNSLSAGQSPRGPLAIPKRTSAALSSTQGWVTQAGGIAADVSMTTPPGQDDEGANDASRAAELHEVRHGHHMLGSGSCQCRSAAALTVSGTA